jgi:hypothetical protein
MSVNVSVCSEQLHVIQYSIITEANLYVLQLYYGQSMIKAVCA